MEEHLGGELKINLKGYCLRYTTLPERPKKIIDIKLPALTQQKQSNYRPPEDYPWRKPFLIKKSKVEVLV